MSEVRLRGGGFVAGALVTAAGLGESALAATAAPAASSAAPVSVGEGRFAGVAAGAAAATGGRGEVSGRFALLAESFCEGRMPVDAGADGDGGALMEAVGASDGATFRKTVAGREGTAAGGVAAGEEVPSGVPVAEADGVAGFVGENEMVPLDLEGGVDVTAVAGLAEAAEGAGKDPPLGRLNAGTVGSGGTGVICAVGASLGAVARDCAAAGRGGTVGVCAGEPARPGTIDCDARLSDEPVAIVSAGTCGKAGSEPIGCCGGRGVSGM